MYIHTLNPVSYTHLDVYKRQAYGGYDLVMEAYHTALKEDYRFGTYGDAMLILDK